jgi:hypothetical protein
MACEPEDGRTWAEHGMGQGKKFSPGAEGFSAPSASGFMHR